MLAQTPPPAAVHAPPAAPARRYGFGGTSLGADLASWRHAHANAACQARAGGRILACTVADQPLSNGYRARDLTYVFLDGRLARIRFRSSVNGFDDVMAKLRPAFGDPANIQRDVVRLSGLRLPHVEMTWRNGRAHVELSDPVPPGTQLTVNMTLDDAAATLNAS